jgi:hypothetical protein
MAKSTEKAPSDRPIALLPSDRSLPELNCEAVNVQLNALELHRPRQWGACLLACQVWNVLDLDRFWIPRLPPSRKDTRWLNILKTLVCYRLISPGSEWRLHRHWYRQSAMGDLLGEDVEVICKDKLNRCLDQLLPHKKDLFSYLTQRWRSLFLARFDILLYDLTSTYFKSDPTGIGKRQFGYSRDKRSDCVQIVLALIVTPEGFPLAYEVLAGNTSDKTTLGDFLQSIEVQYGQAQRTWVMDRGIPTEEILQTMRDSSRPISYLVGTPKGKLSKLEQDFLAYCLQVTLKFHAQQKATGLTPRAILEKFAAQQMLDVHLSTTDRRRLILSRYTQPDQDQGLLLHQLKLTLPKQPPPRLAVNTVIPKEPFVVPTFLPQERKIRHLRPQNR